MKKMIISAILMVFIIFVMGFLAKKGNAEYPGENQEQQLVQHEKLHQIAKADGKVKIIVKLWVPNIEQLTAESNKYASVQPGQEFPWEGVLADMNLQEEIAYTTRTVLEGIAGTEFRVKHTYSSLPYMALDVSDEALTRLESLPEVLAIEEDVPFRLIEPVEDPEKPIKGSSDAGDPEPPALNGTITLIGADTAWSMGYTGSGWHVAVLDTGIRSTHQFFTGKTIVEACYAWGESGGGDCPNGNATMIGSGAAAHHSSTYEGYDHGTHVSGIAAGNYGGLYGVAKDANIIAVQVFSMFADCDDTTVGDQPCVMSWNSDSLAGLNYVYSIRGSYSIASVNMSLGGGSNSSACDSDSRKTAIDNLRAVGIATAIATGNDGYCGFIGAPACISTSVAVGSSTDTDAESSFNNWHVTMQRLFAPGSSVYSATGASDSSYASWNGTSMATPHVAGSWAVIKQAKPSATVTEILSALQSTGVNITSVCDGYTTPIPRIQIDSAISNLGSKDDLLGTWSSQGVYYRNSDTGSWVYITLPASKITAGDLDNDGTDDLIGIWPTQGGVWVKYSSSGWWAPLSSTADWIAAGDMNGDSRDDLIGTWSGQGVLYRNSATGSWVQMASPATQIAAGDIDNDGTDDLLGIWPGQGGVWVKYSSTGSWTQLSSTADWIAAGDMNGDGRVDLLGTWSGQGVYYRNSATGSWIKMASPASQITTGDIDGDGTDDLVGIWSGQGGVWIKYSGSVSWAYLSSTADWIASGKMRGAGGTTVGIELPEPIGGFTKESGMFLKPDDFSIEGPGSRNFDYLEEDNIIPHMNIKDIETLNTPGPGQPGFKYVEQKNLTPKEDPGKKSREQK